MAGDSLSPLCRFSQVSGSAHSRIFRDCAVHSDRDEVPSSEVDELDNFMAGSRQFGPVTGANLTCPVADENGEYRGPISQELGRRA